MQYVKVSHKSMYEPARDKLITKVCHNRAAWLPVTWYLGAKSMWTQILAYY